MNGAPPPSTSHPRRAALAGRVLAQLAASALETTLLFVMLGTFVFFALRILPGDPTSLVLGDMATERERAQLREVLHFDEPLRVQYARYFVDLWTFDFGDSLRRPGVTVRSRIVESLWPTARLAALAVGEGAMLGISLAVLSRGPWLGRARGALVAAIQVLASIPLLSMAPVVTYLAAVRWRLVPLPGDPDAGVGGILFAASLLALPLGAHVARIARAALGEVEGMPFLRVARAKGGSFARTWIVHALPTIGGPLVTVLGAQLGALLGGAIVLERLFERPGLGSLVLEAYTGRDMPMLEGALVASGLLFVVTQSAARALHGFLDPRVHR
jgi:peptide/nickel transport system permease protein